MHKKTVIDKIEVIRNGTIQVRLQKLFVDDDGSEHLLEYHRTVIEPGVDVDEQFALVNAHLEQMNQPPVDASELTTLKSLVPIVHTEDVVAAYRAEQAKISAARIG